MTWADILMTRMKILNFWDNFSQLRTCSTRMNKEVALCNHFQRIHLFSVPLTRVSVALLTQDDWLQVYATLLNRKRAEVGGVTIE